MKIFFLFYLFVNIALTCDPINIYTNLFPNYFTGSYTIDKGIRIGFISKTRCIKP